MRKMNVFTDFHHAGLLHSLIMLFEGRFNGNVYRPIGVEWFNQGYWNLYNHPATVEQYLGIGGATPDGTPTLNDVVFEQTTHPNKLGPAPGVYHCRDIDSGKTNKAITYAAFMDMRFDIVIASIPQHLPLFRKLCDNHPDHPKLIYQIGNAWPVDTDVLRYTRNILASAIINDIPAGVNFISYHQEFDLHDYFYDSAKMMIPNKITSFVNCFTIDPLFSHDYEEFKTIERMMPEYVFLSYGGQCRDGAKHGSKEVSKAMRESAFIWHVKRGGDGYGHVLHASAAVGRPVVYKKSYYAGKLGERLLIDGLTGIDIENRSTGYIVDKIREYSSQDVWERMCYAMYNRFREIVDFDSEAIAISKFIDNLL